MKPISFFLSLLLFAAFLFPACSSPQQGGSSTSDSLSQAEMKLDFVLKGDSGFVTHSDIFADLQKIHPQTQEGAKQWAAGDTLGKFYLHPETSNHLLCIFDACPQYTRAHLILEITPDGKVVQMQHFISNSQACCWENTHEGFRKVGNDFIIKTCASAQGMCSGYLRVFRTLEAETNLNPMRESTYKYEGNRFHACESTLKISGDSMVVHYVFEQGKIGADQKLQTEETSEADVFRYFENGKWNMERLPELDSLILKFKLN